MSKAKSIFIYFYASSSDATAWMLKFVFFTSQIRPFYAIIKIDKNRFGLAHVGE
jgi:hypothetical protein